jgi:general stress protein 13
VETPTSYKLGDIVEAEVIGLQSYGAFVKFVGDQKGLIHISEVKSGYTKNISYELKVGDKIKAKVIDIDEYNGKISLSIRALENNPKQHHHKKHFFTNSRENIGFSSIEKQMPRWIEEHKDYLEHREK